MISTKKILLTFIPAIVIVFLAVLINLTVYEKSVIPESESNEETATEEIQIPIFPEDPIIGNKKSPISIIMFADIACAGCIEQEALLQTIIDESPNKIKIIWKGLPVTSFPIPSNLAHQYAFCANEQGKFAEFKAGTINYKDTLTTENLNLIATSAELDQKKLTACLNSERPGAYIEKTESLAKILNIQATPTFFILNRQINAPTTIEGWKSFLQL